MQYLQRAAGAIFILTIATLGLFWTVKHTKPSGGAVLPLLYAVLAMSGLAWLVAEVLRLRRERSARRTGNDEMNRLIRREYLGLKRKRLFRRLRREPPSKERHMETRTPPALEDPTPAAPLITRAPRVPSLRPAVGRIHEENLHGGLSRIARSVSQNSATGYGAFPDAASQDAQALAAHFHDLAPRLKEWDAAVARAEAAPIAARKQVERVVKAADMPEGYDQKNVAEIIARFVIAQRNYRIVLRVVRDDFREGGPFWSVFTASGTGMDLKIAQLPDASIDTIKEQAAAHEAALQRIVEDVRDSDRIPEIKASWEAREVLKQPLQNLLSLKQAVSPILFATDCGYCEAQLQATGTPAPSGSGTAAITE